MAAPEIPSVADRRSSVAADHPVVAITGRIGPSETAAICRRVRELICDQGADAVVVDVSRVADPDVNALDALGRLHLMARRFGRSIMISHTSEQLQDLVAFSGLDGVLCFEDERKPE